MTTYSYPYLSPHQSRDHQPTEWELQLASAVENVFSKGAHSLEALVDGLNDSRVRPLNGGRWTAENFTALMRELGA